MKHFKSVLAMLLALVMILSCVGGAFAADKTEVTEIADSKGSQAVLKEAKGFKSEKFQANNTYKYADDEVVRAIVVLEGSPEADVAERGTTKAANTRAKLQNQHANVRKAMTGINYELVNDFTTLLNGFSADVAYGDLEEIAQLDGVEAVYIANHYAEPVLEKEPATRMAISNAFLTGIDDAYYEYGVDGSGMVIAVLDTGVSVTHEAFADADGNCAETGKLTEADLVKAVAPGQYVNAKLPFVYDYAEFDNDVTDYNGHGTHVAGIAAGCAYDAEEGGYTFLGAASGAQILGMKIFYDARRGTDSDIYLAALEDAYRLGADVINMSIGAKNGFTYDEELETVVYGNIYKRLEAAGIVVCVSAGNEYSMAEYSAMGYIGPEYQDYGTVAEPSTFEGNVSVASVENYYYPDYVLAVGEDSFSYEDNSADGLWLKTFGDKEAVEYVVVPGDEDGTLALGYAEDFEGVDVKDKIAVVSRGVISFEEKVENAANAGAIGCIVVNNQAGSIAMDIETYEIPAVSVKMDAADVLLNAEEKKVSSPSEKKYVKNENAGLMSDFSNWGTSPSLTLDPTVTSVGGMVYSASIEGNDEYIAYSGTSMSSPNFAGTVATVLQFLEEEGHKYENDDWFSLTKAEKAERAKALLESSAEVLYDELRYPYSPRKQGAGLANAVYALDAYDESAFIIDPIQELGDDAKKTGHYTFPVTLMSEGDYSSFLVPSEELMYDYVYNYGSEEDPLLVNTLISKYLYDGEYTANYTVDGVSVNDGFWIAPGETVTVTVDIQLDAEIMEYFDGIFPNGNYVEGFVFFDDVRTTDDGEVLLFDADGNAYLVDADGAYRVSYNAETEEYDVVTDAESGDKIYANEGAELSPKIYNTTHATMLTFYGDWTDGDILEAVDFRDVIEAEYWLNATEEGQAYAAEVAEDYAEQYGLEDYEPYFADVLEFYTSPTMAYTTVMDNGKPAVDEDGNPMLIWYLGDNLFDYTEFYEEHISFSTDAADADGFYANGMYIAPYQLRNCRNLIMTVTDKETGEVYYVDNTEYLPKAVYDEDYAAWRHAGVYYWDGTDVDGKYVPSGTKVTVRFDAVLPYGEDPDGKWDGTFFENVLSFDCKVDYTAPVIEDIIFDEEAQTLTVTASDESYLANIALFDENCEPMYDENDEPMYIAAFSSDQEGKSFTATFDVSELMADGYDYVTVAALDYATNETDAKVDFTTEPCNHSHTEIKDAVAAGCETQGYSGDTYCTDCGALIAKGNVIAAKGHKWDAGVISKPTTCTEDGTRTYLCANCGQTRVETIKASGHIFGDWVVTKPATAAVKGEKQRTCAICGYVGTAEIDALGYQKCYVVSFDDCGKTWYHEAIDFAVANGLMNGVADTKFDPDGTMTRAMVVTVLYRQAGEPKVTAPSTFTDVAEGQWYSDAIAWAQDAKVVDGVAADKFAPNDNVTREQLATILWRYSGKPEAKADLSKFKDVDNISGYALEAMNWAVKAGIFCGDNGNLKPTANATRAEFATMIMRYLGNSYECDQMKNAG